MRFAIVGLGRMGLSLGELAVQRGHQVVAWDPAEPARAAAQQAGMQAVPTLENVPAALPTPRVVLLWVPHGAPVDDNLEQLLPHLQPGDVLADCGNSFWEDSARRHDELAKAGVHFLDIGTSGGISQAPGWTGAAFMAGGPREGFEVVAPLLRDLAVDEQGVLYVGPASSGHFVKLVHNAIEFGMVQAIAEGVDMLRGFEHDLDLPGLFEHWNHGSVIRGWLVELMGHGLRDGARRCSTSRIGSPVPHRAAVGSRAGGRCRLRQGDAARARRHRPDRAGRVPRRGTGRLVPARGGASARRHGPPVASGQREVVGAAASGRGRVRSGGPVGVVQRRRWGRRPAAR